MSGTTDSQNLSDIYGFPVPDTWVADQSITADWLNRNVRDSQIFLTYAPLTIVSREANQSIPNNSETNITWDTETVDTDEMFSSPSTDVTIQRPGVYAIQHSIDFASNSTGIRATHVAVNGTTICENGGDASTISDTGLVCSSIAALNEGDVITAFCYQNSGASLNIQTGTRLSIRLLSTASIDVAFTPTSGGSTTSGAGNNDSSPPTAPSPTKHSGNYYSQWSRTYDGDNSTTWDDSRHCYQGFYDNNRGNTKSLVGLNYSLIQSDLSVATKITGTLHFKVAHSYYNAGMTVKIGTHTYTSKPSTWSSSNVYQNQISRSSCVAGRTYSVNLTSWQCWALQQGVIKGIAFGPGPNTSRTYYGYLYGDNEGGEPYITLTYYK